MCDTSRKCAICGGIDFKQEYKDEERYPFFCDFYFPKTDTFLEINGYWMHNHHFFNINDPTDLECLKSWEIKAKESDAYKCGIVTWTKCDIEKRDTALRNGLNYVVLWSRDEVEDFCEFDLADLI